MMLYRQSPLEVAVKGAIAGLAGTVVITLGMTKGPKLMEALGLGGQQSGGGRPTGQHEPEEPTEKLARKVATGVLETPIEDDTKEVAGEAIRWGYGAFWGAVYGIIQGSFQFPGALHGALFGGFLAAIASTIVPAMGLTPPPTRQPMPRNAMQMALHLLYGWTTALAFDLLSRD